MRRIQVWAATALVGLALPVGLGAAPADAATAARPYDFDGDGRAELVVGAAGLQVGSVTDAGGVAVLSPLLPAYEGRVVTQSTKDVKGASESGDAFGAALASADFDRDGYADLAVGQPGETLGKTEAAGAVTVLYGSSRGLRGKRSLQFGDPGGRVRYSSFGSVLAVGDLDGDGYPDLAVGAPGDRLTEEPGGTVAVLRGGASGLTTKGSRRLSAGKADYRFGAALAVTDADADGRADLLVVASGQTDDDDGEGDPGALSLCRGGSALPRSCSVLVAGDDYAGTDALAVGNVSGDARPEVLLGGCSSIVDDAGHLDVLTLAGTGAATRARGVRFDQRDAGVPGGASDGCTDSFGEALLVGDVTGDAYADVVVGAPREVVDEESAGRVILIRGGSAGLARSGNVAYDEATRGVPGGAEDDDRFGGTLGLVDRDADGRVDLVIGAPREDDGGGRVTILPGTGRGFTVDGASVLTAGSLDYAPRAQAGFGSAIG